MRAKILPTLLLGSWLPALSLAAMEVHGTSFTPDHILRVTVATIPSGCKTRTAVIVNGTSPGPAIHVLPGSTSWIRVYNDMDNQNLTMHWHGLTQRMAPFADGSPQASQWPIPPGRFFDYQIVTTLDDSGTYFYHSHVQMQAMSCAGSLIVDDCGGSSPYNYDDERILFFTDFFEESDQQMFNDLTAVPFRGSSESNGVLLNGIGVASGQIATKGPAGGNKGRFGSRLGSSSRAPAPLHARDVLFANKTDDQTATASGCSLPVIDVDPGKTYRFRFIGGTGLSFLSVAFEGHGNLTIVQVDGNEYNAPVTTGHLQIGPGQRFDVLLTSKTAAELKADGNKMTYFIQFETLDRPWPYRGYGVLRYSSDVEVPTAPANPIAATPKNPQDWLEYTFTPLNPGSNAAPTAAEVTRRVTILSELITNPRSGKVEYRLAGLSWNELSRSSPLLVDIYRHGQAAMPDFDAAMRNNGWDPKTLSFPAKIGEVLEIVIQNTGSLVNNNGLVETHPFHAHSQHYYDIGRGDGEYDAQANNAKMAALKYVPVRRDTTMLYRFADKVKPGAAAGWRAWRMRMDNPGVWMIHCHVLAHMMMGMQTIWTIGSAADIMKIPCNESQGYLTYGGNVYGTTTTSPSYYQYGNGTNQCVPTVYSSTSTNMTWRAL
ncbi:Cupredoxin [Apodospora peruviana]|uniref:Cupredoxin n=1 Tax=Apodospora peruviana TaxID=516989 RepID=A0AAE0M3H6_9PEZI|nr:Cupredoxin [Apodospora peruviana]